MVKDNISELEKIISSGYGNTAGILVHKSGETKYEHYFNGYTPDKATHIFSVTKSIISILIGISFAALGDGGNVIYVNPAKKIVIVIASLFKPLAKDRIELIKVHIEPMFDCK
jgi:CubicO group peptidase (beta-lactamase class C family)